MQRLFLGLVTAFGVTVATAVVPGTALAADGEAGPKPGTPVAAKVEAVPVKHHMVAAGESLSVIAQNEGLDSWRPLYNANLGVEDPNLIYPDQDLVIPNGATEDRALPAGLDAEALPVYAPAPVAAAQHQAAARSAALPNYAQGAGGILERIRLRESGGNYAINTGNGYYGAYQFSLGTWQSVGGSGLPSDASPAEQDMRAQTLYNQRGCSPWPNTCY